MILAPPLLFGLIRPDWYYVQNGLDPYFYSGYVQNFANVMNMSGRTYYFVTRFPLYGPGMILYRLTGSGTAAYLLFHWALASVVLGSVVLMGWRRWRLSSSMAAGVLILLMPMLLRSLLSDYSDALTVPAGMLLVALLLYRGDRWWAQAAAGVLVAGIVLTQPISISLVGLLGLAWLVLTRPRQWARGVGLMAATFALVLLAGWALFRFRYGVANVYLPSYEQFQRMRDFVDLLRSPRSVFLAYRMWLHLPALMLLAYLVSALTRVVPADRRDRALVAVLAAQYAFQAWQQFVRKGITLEVPYYFSAIYPPLLLVFGLLVCAWSETLRRWVLPACAAAMVLAALLLRTRSYSLPSWIAFAVAVLVVGGLVALLRRHGRSIGVVALVALTFAAQLFSPRPEPRLPTELRVEAGFESVYNVERSEGVASFHTASWFSKEMQTKLPVRVQRDLCFLFAEPVPSRMAAMFQPHTSYRWLGFTVPLTPAQRASVFSPRCPSVAILGQGVDVAGLEAQVRSVRPTATKVYEGVSPDAAQVKILVYTSLPPDQR